MNLACKLSLIEQIRTIALIVQRIQMNRMSKACCLQIQTSPQTFVSQCAQPQPSSSDWRVDSKHVPFNMLCCRFCINHTNVHACIQRQRVWHACNYCAGSKDMIRGSSRGDTLFNLMGFNLGEYIGSTCHEPKFLHCLYTLRD